MKDGTKKYMLHNTSEQLNTSELLINYYKKHRTRKAALARAMGRSKSMVLRYQKNTTIQTAILWEFSMVLKHNFFMDIAAMMPAEFSTYAPQSTADKERIAELEQKLKLVEAERDVLLRRG